MIYPSSRYANSPVITTTGPQGNPVQAITPGPQSAWTFSYTTYQVTGNDRPDTIAAAFYGDATKWYVIADGNPEILDWSNMPVGAIIRIPNP